MRPNRARRAWLQLAPTLAVLLIAGASAAEIYRWTDASGVEHFAMDPSQVPARYRGQAVEGAQNRRDIQVMGAESNRSGRSRSERPSSPAASPGYDLGADRDSAADRPGGHDKSWWQREHNKVLGEIKRTENQLERAERLMPSSSKQYAMRTREAGGRASVETGNYEDVIRFSETAVREARLAHDDFHMLARRAGVLPAWIRD